MKHNLEHKSKYSYAKGKVEEMMVAVTDESLEKNLDDAFLKNDDCQSYHLDEIYMTDMAALGCTIVLKAPAVFITPFFERYDASIIYEDTILSCELTYYLNGNGKILSLKGEKAQELADKAVERREKRKFFCLLRMFFRYLFFMLGIPTGTMLLFFILQGNLFGALLAFLLITVLYIVHTVTLNCC